jgi:D-alanine transaminase
MPELAYLNGKFMPIESAMVPIEDRGYQFGDAVYEVIASYEGKLFCVEEHLDRLERSMRELAFPPVSRDEVRDTLFELFKRSGFSRAGIYIQVSRGVAVRNHPFPETSTPQIVMTVREVSEVPQEYRENGISVITMTDFRWGRCDIKTVQLLPNTIAKQRAIEAGVYDTIFVTEAGVVREATSSNLFVVKNGILITHPLTENILAGITRMVVIDLCRELDLPVEERFYSTDEMFDADEAFLSGTTTEVLPIVQIDEKIIGDGKIGPIASRLSAVLQRRGLESG